MTEHAETVDALMDMADDLDLLDDATAAGFEREAVEDLLADRPAVEEQRPALRKLNDDQREVLAEFVDGFETRREFVEWCQRTAVLTLGELPGSWYRGIAFSPLSMSTVLTSRVRYRWGARADGEVLDPETARVARRGVVALDLLPAFSRAHRRLRWNATEYVNDDDDSFSPDPDVQKHTAMRPGLTALQQNQAWALGKLLDGFENDDALLSWCLSLVESSFAEADASLAKRFYAEGHTRDLLLGETDDNPAMLRFVRESIGAKYLLPAFARAAREVGERAGELAEQETAERNFKSLG